MKKRTPFTLIELVVALSIISVITTLAVASFRGETPAQIINIQSLKFKSFCAQVRFRTAEHGRDMVLRLNPETKEFTADFERDEKEIEKMETEGTTPLPPLSLKLPEKFSISTVDSSELQLFSGESLEIFRFHADGGGSGKHRLTFQYDQLMRNFEISPLTGRIIETEDE